DNINLNHSLNINADIQLDSFHSIKINAAFSQQDTKNRSLGNYKTITDKNSLLNDGSSDNVADNSGYNFTTGILYRKKFHRKGRTFSVNLQGNFNNSDGNGRLKSLTRFYDTAGVLLSNDSINQQSTSHADLNGYTARVVYTEPIFKRSLLEFSVGRTYNKNTAAKETFDYNTLNGKFDLLNAALTNDFASNYNSNNAGIRLRKQTKKYNFALGISLQKATLEGSLVNSDHFAPVKKTFSNLLPNARFQYQFSRYKNITLNYTTSTNQPLISQLQPIPDNSDRLSIKVGNPDLDQEYNHTLRLNAMFSNPFKNRTFFVFASFQLTKNKIVNSNNINNLGIDSVMLVNTNAVYNFNSSASYSFPVRFLKATMEISSVANYSKGKQFLQGLSNNISQLMIAPFMRIDMSPSDKLTIGLSAEISYYNTKYSLQPKANNNYFYQEYGTDIGLELPKGFFFSTDFNYQITNQQAAGYNQHVPIWNMSISKQMLRFNRGELKLSVNDLLNKNTNINRTANLNYIEDRQVNSLRRYFMLTFTYNLSKTGLDKSNEGGGRVIRR
ncbi:MAG: outer membrane beta-barrel protein, partial [Bacteroidota bacterium]